MHTAKTVLVGGGTGFVGHHVVKSLINKQYRVIVLTTRDAQAARKQFLMMNNSVDDQMLQFKTWRDLDTLSSHNHNIVAGINLTGRSIFDAKWTPEYRQQLYDSRIQPSQTMIRFLSKLSSTTSAPVFVGTSAVGYYPVDQPETTFTEYTPVQRGNNSAAELCEAIEQSIEDEISKCGNVCQNYSIMRPGVVLGSEGGALLQMALPFMFGFTFYPNGGSQPFPYIHVDDLANLYTFTMEANSSDTNMQGIVNGTSPDNITSRDFSKHLASYLNRSFMPLIPVPGKLLETVLGKDRALLLNRGQKVFPEKALKAGFHFQYPNIDDALEAICENVTMKGALQSVLKKR